MSIDRTPTGSPRRLISLVLVVLGALLLLFMPVWLLFLAVTNTPNPHIPGTLVILTATGGMALVAIGALVRE